MRAHPTRSSCEPPRGERWREPELSEGTTLPGGPVRLVPSPSPGWTWPLRFRTLAWASRGRTPSTVGCILSRSGPSAFRGAGPRRPSIPIRFSVDPPAEAVEVREPGSCLPSGRSEDRPRRRVREPGRFALSPGSPPFSVSPVFRAAVSLGPLTFAPNGLDGKRPKSCPVRNQGRPGAQVCAYLWADQISPTSSSAWPVHSFATPARGERPRPAAARPADPWQIAAPEQGGDHDQFLRRQTR